MAINIESVEYLEGKLRIRRLNAQRFALKYQEELPEDCFLDYILWERGDPEEFLNIDRPAWNGNGSGDGEDNGLFDELLSYTVGTADLVVCWQSKMTGKRVKDGVVEDREVILKLKD